MKHLLQFASLTLAHAVLSLGLSMFFFGMCYAEDRSTWICRIDEFVLVPFTFPLSLWFPNGFEFSFIPLNSLLAAVLGYSAYQLFQYVTTPTSRATSVRRALNLLMVVAVAAPCFWLVQHRMRVATQSEYGEILVASIAGGSFEFWSNIDSDTFRTLRYANHEFRGPFRRALFDETWGTVELGYCFDSGAFLYLTLPVDPIAPDDFDIRFHVAGSTLAEPCNNSDAAV